MAKARLTKALPLLIAAGGFSIIFGWYFVSMVVAAEGQCEGEFSPCVWRRIRPRLYFDERSPWRGMTGCHVANITSVDASGCELSTVPKAFEQFLGATSIDLRKNDLESFGGGGVLPKLLEHSTGELALRFNPELPRIRVVNWTASELRDLHFDKLLKFAPLLEELHVAHNKLASIEGVLELSHLRVVEAQGNVLAKFPNTLFAKPDLVSVDVSNNAIGFISPSAYGWWEGGFESGRRLRFAHNPITKIALSTSQPLLHPDLWTLSDLKAFDWSRRSNGTKVPFPPGLVKLSGLTYVDLSEDQLDGKFLTSYYSTA